MALGPIRLFDSPLLRMSFPLFTRRHAHSARQTMIMKVHSYISFNGCMQDVLERSHHVYEELRRLTEERPGQWEGALQEAESACIKAALAEHAENTDVNHVGDKMSEVEGVSGPFADSAAADTLRRRLVAVSERQDTPDASGQMDANNDGAESSTHTSSYPITPSPPTSDASPARYASILTHHPDAAISSAAHTFLDLDSELVSTGPCQVRYPENITLRNFAVYMLIPTLVYQLEYPRTDRCVTHLTLLQDRFLMRWCLESGSCMYSKRRLRLWAPSLCCIPSRKASSFLLRPPPISRSSVACSIWRYHSCSHTFSCSTSYLVTILFLFCSLHPY